MSSRTIVASGQQLVFRDVRRVCGIPETHVHDSGSPVDGNSRERMFLCEGGDIVKKKKEFVKKKQGNEFMKNVGFVERNT